MAMITPIPSTKVAFDATQDSVFYFTSNGGNQVVKNKITIRNNSTNEVVYTNTVETYQLSQTVPANTLTNGVYYNFYFNTYDVNNNMSAQSNSMPFWCYTSPTITFTNVNNNDTINSPSFEFEFTYNQIEGEGLDKINIKLYDSYNNLIKTSENLYSAQTPPINFSYLFDGFENESFYSVQAESVSVNGTIILSPKITFETKYSSSDMPNMVNLINFQDEGYVRIENNFIPIDGNTNISPIVYIDNSKLEIDNYGQYVKWVRGYSLNQEDFTLGIWGTPYQYGEICRLWGEDNNSYYKIVLEKEIPNDEFSYKSCAKLFLCLDGEETLESTSNYVAPLNNLSQIVVYIRQDENGYTTQLNVISSESNSMEWDTSSNVEWNKINDISYIDDNNINVNLTVNGSSTQLSLVVGDAVTLSASAINGSGSYTYKFVVKNLTSGTTVTVQDYSSSTTYIGTIMSEGTKEFVVYVKDSTEKEVISNTVTVIASNAVPNSNVTDILPITKLKLINGTFDNIDFTKDITKTLDNTYPTWDYNTVMNCNFNENIDGGNSNITLSTIDSIVIKRRKADEFNWLSIKTIPISSISDFNFYYNDTMIPTGETFEYALVPCLNGVESNYLINTITTCFDGVFISDKDNIYKLYAEVQYGDTQSIQEVEKYNVLGNKYPTIIRNGNANYQQGSLSGTIINKDFEQTRILDRSEIVKQNNKMIEFLKNGLSKIIKDWNGNIWLVQIMENPTVSYNNSYGMGKVNISFNWVEQGKYDNEYDLKENDLI